MNNSSFINAHIVLASVAVAWLGAWGVWHFSIWLGKKIKKR